LNSEAAACVLEQAGNARFRRSTNETRNSIEVVPVTQREICKMVLDLSISLSITYLVARITHASEVVSFLLGRGRWRGRRRRFHTRQRSSGRWPMILAKDSGVKNLCTTVHPSSLLLLFSLAASAATIDVALEL
jgi:hypothetical protein